MTEQEYLVIENTGEVLSADETITLVAVEEMPVLMEVVERGPQGEAYSGGPIDMHGDAMFNARTVGFTTEYDNGTAGASKTIYLSNGQKQRVVLSADSVLHIDTAAAGCGNYQIRIKQDNVGGHQPSFPDFDPDNWVGYLVQPECRPDPNTETVLSLYWSGSDFLQSLTKVGAI